MYRIVILAAIVFCFSMLAGCTFVHSATGGSTVRTNDTWFTENTSVLWIPISTRVYYCPPANPGTPATCTEAEMLEAAPAAPAAPAATPVPAPMPESGEGEGGEGVE